MIEDTKKHVTYADIIILKTQHGKKITINTENTIENTIKLLNNNFKNYEWMEYNIEYSHIIQVRQMVRNIENKLLWGTKT